MGRPPRLILAYVIVAMGGLAFAGAVTGSKPALISGAVLGWFAAMVHAFSFVVRRRKRRQPALHDRRSRGILAATLGAIGAAVLGNFVLLGMLAERADADRGRFAVGLLWCMVTLVLAWRAWILPSARRAAILQAVAVWFAVPQTIVMISEPDRHGIPGDLLNYMTTSAMISFTIVGVAGAVLDKLYAGVADREATSIPEAVAR